MNAGMPLSPFSLPPAFRAYVYEEVILAWETKRVRIVSSTFSPKALRAHCGLDAHMLGTLDEVRLRDLDLWPTHEFLSFLRNGSGYECLFKRLRDTFAHGHYGSSEWGWIAIRHRYRGSRETEPNTRAFGNLRITTLKKLIRFLDEGSA